MTDMKLICIDDKQEFIFTEGEQAFYKDRGLAEPKRCSICRLKRRAQLKTGQPFQSSQIDTERPVPTPESQEKPHEQETKTT